MRVSSLLQGPTDPHPALSQRDREEETDGIIGRGDGSPARSISPILHARPAIRLPARPVRSGRPEQTAIVCYTLLSRSRASVRTPRAEGDGSVRIAKSRFGSEVFRRGLRPPIRNGPGSGDGAPSYIRNVRPCNPPGRRLPLLDIPDSRRTASPARNEPTDRAESRPAPGAPAPRETKPISDRNPFLSCTSDQPWWPTGIPAPALGSLFGSVRSPNPGSRGQEPAARRSSPETKPPAILAALRPGGNLPSSIAGWPTRQLCSSSLS